MKFKAIRVRKFGGPEVLRIEETETADPGPGEILVKLEAAGINPVDTYQREGSRGYSPELPWTPGLDGAGTVASVGKNAGRLKEGDSVYLAGSLTGTYAEYAVCRADRVFPLPAGLDFRDGAALYVNYFTACRALFQRGAVRPGEKVLVHGASGGVGTAALQWLRWKGIEAAATAGTPEGIRQALEQGASEAVNHRDEEHCGELLSRSAGGFDLILEMAADRNLGEDPGMLSNGGRIIVIGSGGSVSINPRDLMKRDADIRGIVLFNASDADISETVSMLNDAAAAGFIKPVIRKTFPLSRAAEAHRLLKTGGAAGKIILEI